LGRNFLPLKPIKIYIKGSYGLTRLRGEDEVSEDGIVGGKGWQEKVYNRVEWKKVLRTARNCRILHMPME